MATVLKYYVTPCMRFTALIFTAAYNDSISVTDPKAVHVARYSFVWLSYLLIQNAHNARITIMCIVLLTYCMVGKFDRNLI